MLDTPRLTFGSVCSGIEAASVAWHSLGWRAAWLSEIDKGACAVLEHRFPDVPNHGDMTLLAGKVRRREIPAPDLLVGGTPCQSFSVAGMRRGLDDPRGQLTIAFIDLINAIDEIRAADGLPPVIVVWENVPGVLTHKDNPFGCFLAGVAGETDVLVPAGRKWTNAGAVFGPERAVAWTVRDAQYFGLAQRRRRVFVVASAREGFDPVAVLLEFDGVRRDSAPCREAGEGVAGTLDARTEGGGFPGTDGACNGHVVPVARPHSDGPAAGDVTLAPVPTWWDGRDVSQTLDAVLHKGQTMPEKNRFPAVLQPVVSVALRGREGGGTIELGDEVAGCLRASTGGGDKPHVLAPIPILEAGARPGASTTDPRAGMGVGKPGDPMFTLQSSKQHAIAFSCEDYGADATDELAPTLRAMGHAGSHPNAGGQMAVCIHGTQDPDVAVGLAHTLGRNSGQENAVCVTEPVTHTLKAEGFDASEDDIGRGQPIVPTETYRLHAMNSSAMLGDGNAQAAFKSDIARTLDTTGGFTAYQGGEVVLTQMAVRRLMPVECERLQGFPDGWTLVPVGKTKGGEVKWAADGPRYKQLGNSMAVNVMHWIGARIAWQLRLSEPGNNGGPPIYDDPLLDLL